LGDAAAKSGSAFDGEATLRPMLGPGHQGLVGAGVDGNSSGRQLVAGRVQSYSGQRGLVRVDSDGDHGSIRSLTHPGNRAGRVPQLPGVALG
jgi:hypothetical protein